MSDTLAAVATHVLEVKHSRFIVQAAPATSAETALAFLAQVADPEATHNCWAYRIGAQYRSSDDGEPSGTAGRPILAAIEGQGYDQVVAVVTRWYGGIKLGAGGLVRAYGGAAAECLRRAERRRLIAMCQVWLACPFDDIGTMHAALTAVGARKIDETFDESGARLLASLPADRMDDLKTLLRDATRNRASLVDAQDT